MVTGLVSVLLVGICAQVEENVTVLAPPLAVSQNSIWLPSAAPVGVSITKLPVRMTRYVILPLDAGAIVAA